jgi:hypothetical protein
MATNDPAVGRIAWDGTRTPLKTALFLVVCVTWLLPGLVGHDPWKYDEAVVRRGERDPCARATGSICASPGNVLRQGAAFRVDRGALLAAAGRRSAHMTRPGSRRGVQ